VTRAYRAMAIVGGAQTSLGTWYVDEHGQDAECLAVQAAALWQRVHGGYAWVVEWTDADAARLDVAIGIRSA
jgi:hypothetical protein